MTNLRNTTYEFIHVLVAASALKSCVSSLRDVFVSKYPMLREPPLPIQADRQKFPVHIPFRWIIQ